MRLPETLPPKKDVARALLLRGSVLVHLDPRGSGVEVPDWFKNQPQLVLQVGLDMPVPIPDLRVDDTGVYGTLSFNRSPFTCSVPWAWVFALVGEDGRGMVWPDSMPVEITEEIEREAGRQPPPPPAEMEDETDGSDSPKVVRLADHRGVDDEPTPPPTRPRGTRKKRAPRPPYLRVVK